MCLLYQCRAQILMLILHERNLSFVSERCFFLFGCFALSSQVCSSRSLGKEARGSGGTGTKLMVMSRKIFWIVGCKIDFARAMLHIKARDVHQSRREPGDRDRNTEKTTWSYTKRFRDLTLPKWSKAGPNLKCLDPYMISFFLLCCFFKKQMQLYSYVFCWSKTLHFTGFQRIIERRKGKELFWSLKTMFSFFLIKFLILKLFQN